MAAVDANARAMGTSSRTRILREARALFTAQGYAAVSMQQIADASGVNKATLYHHFRHKEDLFISVMDEELARMAADVSVAIAAGGSLREQLTRVAAHIFASSQSDFGRLVADLHEQVPAARRAEMLAHRAPPWDQIRDAVARAALAGEVRDVDPDLVARLFFAMVRGQVWWSKFGAAHPEPDARLAATIADLLLDGVGDDPARRNAEADAAPRV